MIVADSKDENCINRLTNILERTYPGLVFNILSNYTSRIEIPDGIVNEWEKDKETNPHMFDSIIVFCDGFTTGWESAND